MLRSQLGLWCYTSPTTSAYPLIVREYGEVAGALEYTTVAPGGFGDLAFLVKLSDGRIPRPELGLFSRVVLRDGLFTCFAGEIADPALVMSEADGEYVMVSALGAGLCLRDDPDESSYASQTAQAIIAAEFSKRSAYLPLDSDLSQVLPSNPAGTFSPVYDGFNLEEIVHDLSFALGDYAWGVWDHGRNLDAAGFPTWQLFVHPRDAATTHYTAYAEDVIAWRVAPSAQRAYNVVEVAYVDPTGGPGKVLVADTRLAGSGAQNQAPFRRRKLRRALGRVPLTSAQATTIANAWLAAYQNITNKIEVELRTVRDAGGKPIPLTQVRADRNLFIPELAVRGQVLSASAVPGTNQFYIVETVYRERENGDVRLLLYLDNYQDRAGSTLAQLKLSYDAALRSRGEYRRVQSPGAAEVGSCGATFSNVAAGGTVAIRVNFKTVLAKAPSSITLTVTGQSNTSGVTATGIDVYGFTLQWTAPASGASSWIGTYQTVGN
jgi:hypothetical protein